MIDKHGTSALGQKQTCAPQMSALPPKADIGAAQINVCKGHKRTYVATTPGPSLKPQNLSSCVAHITLQRADRD